MVLHPSIAPRGSSSRTAPGGSGRSGRSVSAWLVRMCLAVLAGILYVVSTTKPPADENHHWTPPFLDFFLGPSHDAPHKASGAKGTAILMNPSRGDVSSISMKPVGEEGSNETETDTDTAVAINVPTLLSKMQLPLLGDKTEHLGIMVDAGRHHFPVAWLESLLEYMAGLGYNWLHLRLTDDQAFRLRLQSRPELGHRGGAYAARDLHRLVARARGLGIAIVPEVNVPGHAASWAPVPGLIVPCPRFACTYGYGIPLNVSSPKLMPVIKDVLTEVQEIFGSKYIHLGGDEVEQSEGCFQEAGDELPNYDRFESQLKSLVETGIGFQHVLRWEQHPDSALKRAGDVTQYWRKSMDDYSDHELHPHPFFASTAGLYMDVNGNDNAYKIYQETKKCRDREAQGIVVGTFELSTEWFMSRNVFGRMIAVSMALTGKDYDDEASFLEAYQSQCFELLGKDSTLCALNGEPVVPFQEWRERAWGKTFTDWKLGVCAQLTDRSTTRVMRNVQPLSDQFNTRQAEEIALAREIFMTRLKKRQRKELPTEIFTKNKFGKLKAANSVYVYPPRPNRKALFQHKVGHTGVTVDLSRYFFPVPRLHELVERLSRLGFNTLHLRLVDDFSFAVETKSHPDVALATRPGGSVYAASGFRDLAEYAHSLSVEIVPEVNVVSRAGGWFAAGFAAPCPNHICARGFGIPLNLTNVPLMAAVSNVVEELRLIFNSPFLHLGYDERDESKPCLQEAKIKLNFDDAEQKLLAMLAVINISPGLVIRWESSDDLSSSQDRRRAGSITHYQYTNPPSDADRPFFVSTDLRFDRLDNDAYEIYKSARQYAEHDMILGLLAGTMEMSPQAWNGRNVEGKLVAVAMGLSAAPEMGLEEFTEVYKKTCYELRIEGDTATKLFGKARWTEERWQAELVDERKRRTNSTCERMTGEMPSRKMKDELLGE